MIYIILEVVGVLALGIGAILIVVKACELFDRVDDLEEHCAELEHYLSKVRQFINTDGDDGR